MTTSRPRGFSLIELLVVMAIIAALVTIALPRYQATVQTARLTALKENLRVLRTSLDRHFEDRGTYPESLQALVEAKYLKSVPVDPVSESAQSWILMNDPDGEVEGVVDVRSGAQGMTPDGVPYADL
ncbi:type II secretion system protein [Lysobacter arvi]|uniref:Prepilin-type N-terminal cleavage/methylation domain-containing protein n=1 Tax=Lysobacter arvi TaxID=3038776 RepID=A0ABU1C8K5_9GAMM|nr:prepilin-type N-terminal cleavage/methylation domain-containing protein [Lysobacter arvi]MDR0181448.1 prepilin-type N-terminal cleavage/methylation domain-containing protein [Lysobacter arvi]